MLNFVGTRCMNANIFTKILFLIQLAFEGIMTTYILDR